jgi:hypothetical protein
MMAPVSSGSKQEKTVISIKATAFLWIEHMAYD